MPDLALLSTRSLDEYWQPGARLQMLAPALFAPGAGVLVLVK